MPIRVLYVSVLVIFVIPYGVNVTTHAIYDK